MVAEDLVGCSEGLLGVPVAVADEAFERQSFSYRGAEGGPLREVGKEGGFADVELPRGVRDVKIFLQQTPAHQVAWTLALTTVRQNMQQGNWE